MKDLEYFKPYEPTETIFDLLPLGIKVSVLFDGFIGDPKWVTGRVVTTIPNSKKGIGIREFEDYNTITYDYCFYKIIRIILLPDYKDLKTTERKLKIKNVLSR